MNRSELEAGEDERDPDTTLILAYVTNRLSEAEEATLQARARADVAFRRKLADLVLLRGLVSMAFGRHLPPDPECARIRRILLSYVRGTTSHAETAELSAHLEECLECEAVLEGARVHLDHPAGPEGGWWARTRSRVSRWRFRGHRRDL